MIAQCALQALLDDELDLEGLCTQTDDQCMPESDQPAHGIPLLGTVVVGVPVDSKTPGQKMRQPKQAGQAKPKQPKKAKRGRAAAAEAAAELAQQQAGVDSNPIQQPDDAANPQAAAVAPVKKKAKYRKRKAVMESPPRLPPISPGALSLQEGIKRRRLAKEAEAQAAAAAAGPLTTSQWLEEQTDTGCCPDWEKQSQAAAAAASGPVTASASQWPEEQTDTACCPDFGQQSQAAEEQDASYEPSLSQPPMDRDEGTEHHPAMDSNEDIEHQQQHQQQEGSDHMDTSDLDVSSPTEAAAASPAGPAEDSQQSDELSPQQAVTERQSELTLSFDVAAMELFQQQDTCDAFGSFWRRTSGAGVKGKGPVQTQADEAVPAALGGMECVT